MENILLSAAAFVMATTLFGLGSETDPVKKAAKENDEKADNDLLEEDVADFLVQSADARMMGGQEGKLAVQKGTTASIKEYGQLMINDQSMLLEKIEELASTRNITLPTRISNKKESGREDLAEKEGEDFDKKFIKMMIIDHERDTKLFKKAIEFEDAEVSAFAKTYLTMIESHLVKINSIKETSKK